MKLVDKMTRVCKAIIKAREGLLSKLTNLFCYFRILVQICKTKAFQKLNPAQFELHEEVCDAIQVSDPVNVIITYGTCMLYTTVTHD